MRVRHGSLFAVTLIIAGTLLFLDNLGVLPVRNIGAYWPLLLVVWGATLLEHRRMAPVVVWAVALMVAGILLTLGNLHVIHMTAAAIWPLALIAFGLTMLTGKPWSGAWDRDRMRRHWASSTRQRDFSRDRLAESAVFSNAERRVETQNFEGGEIDAVFGGIELDLTNAVITSPDRRAVIRANAVFGGIEIAIPRTWRVERQGSAVFGSFEDKTIPPRPEPGVDPLTLLIEGDAVFGSVVVRN